MKSSLPISILRTAILCSLKLKLLNYVILSTFANRKDLNQLSQSVTVCPYCLQIQYNSSTCSRQTTIFWNKGAHLSNIRFIRV